MASSGTHHVTPMPRLTQISVRVTPASAPLAASALGIDRLPGPNEFTVAAGCNVLWLGPDEFLAIAGDGFRAALEATLREAIPVGEGMVVDVSAQRCGLWLSGQDAREALAGCCPLDFHPREFRTGMCASTLIAKAQVTIAQVDDAPTYLILVRPSFLAYVKGWLSE